MRGRGRGEAINVAGTYGAIELSGSKGPGSATDGLCGAALSYVVCCESGRGFVNIFKITRETRAQSLLPAYSLLIIQSTHSA